MKLYTKVASERAEKGQGGNKEVVTTLYVGSAKDSRPVGLIKLKKELVGYSIIAQLGGERVEVQLDEKGERQTSKHVCNSCIH